MSPTHQENTDLKVMRILQANPDITQRELAQQVGISVGGLNYCLNALIDKCLVKMQNFSASKNKFKYVYLLTPKGMAEKIALTGRFLSRKIQEYEALRLEIETLQTEVGAVSAASAKSAPTAHSAPSAPAPCKATST